MNGLIKYCTEEYNIQKNCNTIQLGTFDYYREMDPQFAIADASEGLMHYIAPQDIEVTVEQYNSFLGGGATLRGPGISELPKHHGATKITLKGGGIEFGENGVKATVGEGSEVEIYYPNSFMFCSSIFTDGDKVEPKKVSDEYNSFYHIKMESINDFATSIAILLEQQLNLGDFKIEGNLRDKSLAHLNQGFKVSWIAKKVDYVNERKIYLKSKEDFDLNRYYQIYFESMFKKHLDYSADNEFRILFFVQHPTLGIISMNKKPKLLELNPLKKCLQ